MPPTSRSSSRRRRTNRPIRGLRRPERSPPGNKSVGNQKGSAVALPCLSPTAAGATIPRKGCRSVLVTARAVDVAVLKLFLGGRTHVLDLDVEVQGLAGQFVVAVEGDLVAVDFLDGHDGHAAFGLRLEAH